MSLCCAVESLLKYTLGVRQSPLLLLLLQLWLKIIPLLLEHRLLEISTAGFIQSLCNGVKTQSIKASAEPQLYARNNLKII